MKIAYSDHGTILIECNGSTVEVPLEAPAVTPPTAQPPAPHAPPKPRTEQPPDSRPIQTLPPRPRHPPGTMIIRPIGASEPDRSWASLLEWENVNHIHMDLTNLQRKGKTSIIDEWLARNNPLTVKARSVLHVTVTADDLARGIDVTSLKSALDAHHNGMASVALLLDTRRHD